MTATLKHQSLGTELRGIENGGVTHFRGIPYAHIPRRFAAAEKINEYPQDLDCTAFG
jgi:carboxylesterase type B